MSSIGVLGGLGPAATVDFLDKLVKLTPASNDREHIPIVAAFLPQTPDRSSNILGKGPDPYPFLEQGVRMLEGMGAGVIVIPCNSAHHWHARLSAVTRLPILHIARACVNSMAMPAGDRVVILATRGALASGFYQEALSQNGYEPVVPNEPLQVAVDECIRQIKAGELAAGGHTMQGIIDTAFDAGASAMILGCTELPIAARDCDPRGLVLSDSSLALAQEACTYALTRNWNAPRG